MFHLRSNYYPLPFRTDFERCIPAFLVSNTTTLRDAFNEAVGGTSDLLETGTNLLETGSGSMGGLNQSTFQDNIEG